jgi:hypothetical protein
MTWQRTMLPRGREDSTPVSGSGPSNHAQKFVGTCDFAFLLTRDPPHQNAGTAFNNTINFIVGATSRHVSRARLSPSVYST